MSLLPRMGTCFHCGHDHGEGFGSPSEVELRKRIGELEQKLAATAAASQAQPAQQDSRAEFEAAAKHRLNLTRYLDGYTTEPANQAWWAWQAARSAPRPVLTDALMALYNAVKESNEAGEPFDQHPLFEDELEAIERAVREGGVE